VLGLGRNNALDPCLLHLPTNASSVTCYAPFSSSYDGGTAIWYGTVDQTTQLWNVYSTSSFLNPTGPGAAPIVRKLSATVPVSADQTTANTAIWNYIISPKTSNSTTQRRHAGESRKPFRAFGSDEGSNPSAPLYLSGAPHNGAPLRP